MHHTIRISNIAENVQNFPKRLRKESPRLFKDSFNYMAHIISSVIHWTIFVEIKLNSHIVCLMYYRWPIFLSQV